MTSLLSAELSATCNALGTYDKKSGRYLIDDFTLNTVKDLIRYLRRDGEDHEIRRHFGQTKVLQTDLLPMLIDHWENAELFDVTLRLLVNLTHPALLLYREEVPVERTARHNYLQILSHLQFYKEETFTKVETWNVFAKKLAKILEIDWSERDEDTGLVIERILILIRNVLHVPADLDQERRPENDASVHDQVLWALNQSGILDIILYMSSENEKQYFMHILEIISHLLREQNASSLADAALQRSVDEKLRDEQELLSIRMSENKQRLNKIKQYTGTRHSRFGGTYVVQNMKSISDNELISLKPLNKISNLDFSGSKKSKLVRPKNRRPVESGTLERRSAFAIRLFLKEFCIEFLNSSYNPLMHYVKDVLVRAKAQQNDESYYLWAVRFFMEFNRGHNFQVGLVSETMSVPMFHYVQQQMEKYYDMIKVEKKKFAPWVRRLHLSLKAYKELLNTLLAMDKSSDPSVKVSAKVLKSNIFYVLEYREFILSTFLNYDDNKMPRSYLVDLLETVHLFLKMLEYYCKKTGLVVQKKVRKKTKSKKQKRQPKPKSKQATEQPVAAWEEVRAQLAVVMRSDDPLEHPPPFDAASDVPLDQQKEECMKKIQRLMREYKFEDAVGMFRAAREVWPEEGIFGVTGIEEDEELNMLETIYNTDLGVELTAENVSENENQDNSEDDEEDEEEEEKTTAIVETDFDFQDFVQRFCHPRVVSACVYLLENYDKNTPYINHCIVKMLHRIAWDCKRPAMMYQGTLFLIFQKILDNSQPQYKELEKFAIFILRKFAECASRDSKVFIELLFWKTSKDAIEVEHGYDLYADQKDKPGKGAWSEEQEEELRKLYMENQTSPQTDQDVIDWILDNLIDRTRTRRSVIKKLKELGLIFRAPTKRSNRERVREKIPKEFSAEEDSMLKELWETYGDTSDPMGAIMSRMPRKRQKRSFVDRLLELGIIADKRECRKKRRKDAVKSGDRSNASDSSSNESDHDSSGSDRASPIRMKPAKKSKETQRKKTNKPVELSASETARLLVQAVDNGYTEALRWLAENLEEVALDQEAEGFDPTSEGTPLVPLSEHCTLAMEDDTFKKVLIGVGVAAPFDEQETYWRIPSSLHFETIRKRREIIIKAVNKELIIDTTAEEEKSNDIEENVSKENESSDDDDLFDNLRKMREQNTEVLQSKSNDVNAVTKNKHKSIENEQNNHKNNKHHESEDSDYSSSRDRMQKIDEADEIDNENESDVVNRNGTKRKRKKRLISEESAQSTGKGNENRDSEDEADKRNSENGVIKTNSISKSHKRNRIRLQSTDSEDSNKGNRKRNRSIDSDASNSREKMQVIDEADEIDSENENNVVNIVNKKRKKRLISDESVQCTGKGSENRDSDDETDERNSENGVVKTNAQSKSHKRNRKKLQSADSEDSNKGNRKRSRSIDSDENNSREKMQRIDEADEIDSENENNVVNIENKKRKKRLTSEESAQSAGKDKENRDSENKTDERIAENGLVKTSAKRSHKRNRKRFRSTDSEVSYEGNRKRIDSDESNSREKMQNIVEADEINSEKTGDVNSENEDNILSFAKKTLHQDVLPDTEDILSNIPRVLNDDSDDETEELVLQAKSNKKKRKVVIDDDSD